MNDDVRDIYEVLYNEEIKTLTSEADEKFKNSGAYSRLDDLVGVLKFRIEKSKTPLAKFRKQTRRIAKNIALPTVVGVGVVVASAFFKEGAQYVQQQILPLLKEGIIYSAPIPIISDLIGRSIGKKVRRAGKNVMNQVQSQWEKQKKEKWTSQKDKEIVNNIEDMTIAFKDVYQDDLNKARNQVISMIKKYNPLKTYGRSDKLISIKTVGRGIYGYIKYNIPGILFNIFSPINADLGQLGSIGACSHVAVKKAGSMYDVADYDVKVPYHDVLKDLSASQRKQLVGGLLKHWYDVRKVEKLQLDNVTIEGGTVTVNKPHDPLRRLRKYR